jgi:dienelactone hydrolase
VNADLTPPPLRHYLGEVRLIRDWFAGRKLEDSLAARYPGDGRPVMVLPGLFTSDKRTAMLRRVLGKAGYRSHRWKQGVNMPVKADIFDRLDARLDRIDRYGPEPITLIGWSLGGLIAREYAKHAPQRVAAVVTLGSPFSGHPRANRAWRAYELFSDHPVDAPPIAGDFARKPPVPTYAIWSPSDGIIPPRAARGLDHERDEAIEVHCGHLGFATAPESLEAILSLLQRLPRNS